ncbi:MAG TPA: metallophosphoesterase family protein [Kofleriaceae bacterium]|nr:metallophosphoesterase family protein [Kofleriaceae bacterium]
MLRGIACICVLAVAGVGVAAADAPRMLKGPYLQDLAPTSITVMWEMEPQGPATIFVEGPGGTKKIDVKGDRIAEAPIEGLTPSTRYRYRVVAGDQTWQGEFATAPPKGKDVPFSFVVFGDSRYGVEQHRRVVNRMSQEVPDFVLGTGDMVDEGFRQEQWQQFFDVENSLLRDNVYFPALGNHDRQGRGRTADSYRAFFSVPENGDETERYYAFTYASSRFLILDSNLYSFALTDQTSWLERELIAARQDSSIRHIFVVMHHPPFSISLHGGAVELRERWTPLFEQYGVTAVFSGHDHVYSRAEHNGLHYFISGGGGAALYPRRPKSNPVDVAAVKKFERVLHYLRVTITGNRVEVTAVRADGTTIETTSWKDGPEPKAEPPKLAAAGAPPAPAPVAAAVTPPPKAAPPANDGNMMWIGLAGLALALGAAVFVVRSLR